VIQTGAGATRPPLLGLRGVSKRYGGVRALEDVDFAARAGRSSLGEGSSHGDGWGEGHAISVAPLRVRGKLRMI